MGEVFLDKAIAAITSERQKERADGLADLKHILQQNKQSSKLQTLNDKACHKIFESLFRFIAVERSVYNRAQRSTASKSSSTTRLSTCASVVRIAVDVFLRNLRTKSVRAIIDHITETIPLPGESLWEPLSVDYTKCLSALLSYRPHTEHLGDAEWEKLIEFCLAGINTPETDESQLSIRSGRRSAAEDPLDASDNHSTPSRATPAPTPREKYVGDRNAIGEVVVCIQLLTASPNAPIHASAENILRGLADFVKSAAIMAGNAQQLAFNSINTVISKVLFDQCELARSSLLGLVPVIRQLWATTKHHGLKDELLVNVMLCIVALGDTAQKEPSDQLARSIEGLAETLYSEYVRRSGKDVLQLDETIFYPRKMPQVQQIYGPCLGNSRSEHNWTVVWAIAQLLKLSKAVTTRLSVGESANEAPIKRQRMNSGIEDVFRDSISATGSRRICALQLTPFLEGEIDLETKELFLQRLVLNIPDGNGAISSWTMVALESIASGQDARLPAFKVYWPRVLSLTVRAFSSFVTSRAACHLMSSIFQCDLLEHSLVTETVRSMLSSASLNGPSAISDASLSLWTLVARMRNQLNPGATQDASKQICSWLREVWIIGTMTDRVQTAQIASFARPPELLSLLLACTNRPFTLPHSQVKGLTGVVARKWYFFHENRRLLGYMFDIRGIMDHVDPWELSSTTSWQPSARQDPDDTVVLDLLRVKSETFIQAWQAMTEDRSHHITPDVLQVLCSFCIVTAMYVSCLPAQLDSRVQDLQQTSQRLWASICAFLAARDENYSQPCLELLPPLLGPVALSSSHPVLRANLFALLTPLAGILEDIRQSHKKNSSSKDLMDLDDRLIVSRDQVSPDESIMALNRESLPLLYDVSSFQRHVTVHLSILLRSSVENESSEPLASSSLLDYLVSLDESDLLATHEILPEVYRACSNMNRSGLLNILEDLGEKCLQSYEMERCETSLCLCIQMMANFVDSWTSEQNDNLSESAMDLYNWFMDVLVACRKASPKVSVALTGLIRMILASRPSYGSDQGLPSPRTSLFTILQEGDIQVKFNTARFIPSLFQRYILKDHDAIFNDVLESLPRDPDWIEGIALRLFVLSRLASEWHTLLRRSIYHMFETPAQVPSSLWYAGKCIEFVSQNLGLQDARELFRLFSSQILYTWTETKTVMSMPFSIFGYPRLKDMLNDARDEIVGQMIMRGKDQETSELGEYLGEPHLDLLRASFYRAEAYSIARDISTPPGQGSQPKGVEIRLRKLLGADGFMAEIENQFPRIIAILFKSLDHYDQIERAFSKRESFRYALDILTLIASKSSSHSVLPANQQPSFRARYLLDELEFLCKRTGFELEQIWTPTLASFVCRSLLETIHPALGSLHACSVIRKIRILVCVAGPVMLHDYPFEMALHALRPFLADVHCSEDALGIIWYLLESGKAYMMTRPGFTVGIAVSILVTLRKLFLSSPESTTQDSQFRTVLSNSREFHQWLSRFLGGCCSPAWDSEIQESFTRLVSLAQQYSMAEEISNSQSEKGLVLEVLNDRDSKHALLSKPIADVILSLLCPEFNRVPDSSVEDSDDLADPTSHIVSVWHTLHNFNGGVGYRLWAARAFGRSFATTGKINQLLLREQDLSLFEVPESCLVPNVFLQSNESILQVLCDMLQGENHPEAGLVEHTLQLIINGVVEQNEFQQYEDVIGEALMKTLIWSPYHCPAISLSLSELERCNNTTPDVSELSVTDWARNVALFLCSAALDHPVIGSLRKILNVIPSLAVRLMPHIVHGVLLAEDDERGIIRQTISESFRRVLCQVAESTLPHAQLVISCILYLRNQPKPDESTIVDRDKWLDIDFGESSSAAHRCGLHKTSLLFLENQASRVISSSRRSSVAKYEPPYELLHDVFKNIDDPDLFYGIQQSSSLSTVMERLEYEGSGLKNLLFQSAQYDSEIQMSDTANSFGVLKALNATNLQGIANTMLSASGGAKHTSVSSDSMLQAATSLQKWDIPVSPLDSSSSATVFRALQSLNMSGSLTEVVGTIDECLLTTLDSLVNKSRSAIQMRSAMRALGIMTEMSDVLQSSSSEAVEEEWKKIMARNTWLKTESYHEVGEILSWHEALFSSIRKHDYLQSPMSLASRDSQLLEVKVIRQSLEITRSHGVSQASLKSAISLSKLVDRCVELGMNIEGVAKFDLANVLWDQGEMTASIRMLQHLNGNGDLHKQAIALSRSELLVTLGHHVAEARLEKPDSILQEYLYPAVRELKGKSEGEEAGRVYHGFATFCDQQLLNPDGLEDFKRVQELRNRKEKEVLGFEDMLKTAEGKEKESLKIYRAKAKQWFDLDDREYQRLHRSRQAFLQQCLENYLLCLRESDAYNNDVLRFCALWLDKSDSETANAAVARYLKYVPSRKFAPLMNQLSSRLLDVSDDFQSLLTELVFRICAEHPFHGMYQIFASSKSKGGKDQSSHSRYRAANQLVERLKNDKDIGPTWVAVHNVNISYVRFAVDRPNSKFKSGAKVSLQSLSTGQRLGQDVVTYKLPPPTMKIDLRADCDYSHVPIIVKFHSHFTIASGVSAPKIVTAVASDGVQYKQLYKGGNDDLRQDAIMEQVFEQVSSLLKDHQPTRQRNLGIRTYKVLPLTSNSGIIEFVPNTMPLHDFLMPAHQRYFPKDMKPSSCRKKISDVQTGSFEQRIRTYRSVTEHFNPVMKYFFMEKFNNPDDWFSKRLAYTRSTAAISILGHVLGLGDRHGHNILLDEKTGEVVHIDLGVAFEQGRILPVPEVVPFRLTRDLVDGFGITKTEGVFRRCCEFTLEALRQESYSIMTILDVLRYDPLYSWTVSPLRMKKIQDDQEAGDGPPVLPGTEDKSSANEPGEADRALTVVAKKLSKTLSVTATVNELIQQATDEKNLALLYCGWASYA